MPPAAPFFPAKPIPQKTPPVAGLWGPGMSPGSAGREELGLPRLAVRMGLVRCFNRCLRPLPLAPQNTIFTIRRMQAEAGVDELSLLNFVVSDGNSVIATRWGRGPSRVRPFCILCFCLPLPASFLPTPAPSYPSLPLPTHPYLLPVAGLFIPTRSGRPHCTMQKAPRSRG